MVCDRHSLLEATSQHISSQGKGKGRRKEKQEKKMERKRKDKYLLHAEGSNPPRALEENSAAPHIKQPLSFSYMMSMAVSRTS